MSTTPSQTVGVIPPPPGETANFVDPPNQTKGTIALHTVCLFLATFCFVIRLYTRKFINKKLGMDDYCCTIAYLLTVAFSTLLIIGDARGLGRHLWDVTPTQLPAALEALALAEFIYLALVPFIKLSCLFFYKRIFVLNSKTLHFIHGGIAFVVAAYIAVFIATLLECRPIKKDWDPLTPGYCYPAKILPWYSGALNVVTDIFVLVVPLPALAKLQLGLGRRLRVFTIFGLGIFACTASIVRLGMTQRLYSNLDHTWNLSQIGIWAVIEVNIGIVCSCLLTFPSFIKRYWPQKLSIYLTRLLGYDSDAQNKSPAQPNVSKSRFATPWVGGNPSDEEHLGGRDYVELWESRKPDLEEGSSNKTLVMDQSVHESQREMRGA